MSTWLAVLVAAAAFTLTYLFCVRPMMHGRGKGEEVALAAEDPEIANLREELRALRAQNSMHRPPPECRNATATGKAPSSPDSG